MTDLAVRAAPRSRPRRRPGAVAMDRTSLAVAAGLTAVVLALSWYRHATFHSETMDMAVFEQAVWKLAHLKNPVVTTIGWNTFADHLSPVLLLFAPIYRVAATPLWLFAAQAVALGIGYLALEPLFDAARLTGHLRWGLRVAYLASPLLWNAALFDFHPTTLAVPVLLVGLRAALTGDRRALLACSVGLVFLRDDLGLCVAVLALWGSAGSDAAPDRRFRYLLAAAGLAWVVMGGQVGSLLGSDRHWWFHYGYLGSGPLDAATHPLRTLVGLARGVWRADNVLLLSGLLLPLGFLPLLSPRRLALLLLPLLPMLASAGPQFHSPQWHYGAPLFPFLLAAAALGLKRIEGGGDRPAAALGLGRYEGDMGRPAAVPGLGRFEGGMGRPAAALGLGRFEGDMGRPAAALGLRRLEGGLRLGRHPGPALLWTVAAALLGGYVYGPVATRTLSLPTVSRAGARQALALIRPDDVVVASDALAPHLADRDELIIYPYPFADPHPVFPLSPKATEVSAGRAARVDVVITRMTPETAARPFNQAFLTSPWLKDFDLAGQFDDVVVYRRR